MVIEPGTTLDRYVIDGVLGRGGMAVVYRGRHVSLGTPVAIKVLTVVSPDVQARLIHEGRTQGRLRHPNIVSVLDVIQLNQLPCLVMELVSGPNLAALLRAQRPNLEQCDLLARGILEGVAEAHRNGVIHRDLKPENVLVEVSWSGLVPKVTDFGLVKLLRGSDVGMRATRTGTAMGTPAYMAPEQFRDAAKVDERADVFSLGALLYELLSGRQAFAGGDLISVYTASSSNTWVPLEELEPDAPRRMIAAVRGALEADVTRRIRSVPELLDVWTGGGEPVRVDGRITGIWTSPELELARGLAPAPEPAEATVTIAPAPGAPSGATFADAEELPRWVAPAVDVAVPPPRPRSWARPVGAVALAVALLGAAAGAGAAWRGRTVPSDDPGDASEAQRSPSGAGGAPGTDGPPPTGASGGGEAASLGGPSGSAGQAPDGGGSPTGGSGTPGAGASAQAIPGKPGPASSSASRAPRVAEAPDPAPGSSPAAATGPASPEPASPEPAVGSVLLRVNSLPAPTEVTVDGRRFANPLAGAAFPAGPHVLGIRGGDGRSTTQRITLLEGQPLTFCWDFHLEAPCPD